MPRRYPKLNFKQHAMTRKCIESGILSYNMSHERNGLDAGIPGGKGCLRRDSNIPEHPKLSCDDPDECAVDNGGKDKS